MKQSVILWDQSEIVMKICVSEREDKDSLVLWYVARVKEV
jgi:hypothetical protein